MEFGRGQIRLKSIFIMTSIALIVTAAAFWTLYSVVLEQTETQLSELARAQARLIEAVAKYDAIHADEARVSRRQTISQIREAHARYRGFGRTGEIVLAERVDDMIRFMLPEPKAGFKVPAPVPFGGELGGPMTRALSGESGVIQAKDFAGKAVLAAYEYLPFLEAGLVVKIDMSEIRFPFFNAALLTSVFAVVSLLIGTLLHNRMVNPLVDEVFSINEQLKADEARLTILSKQLSKYLSPQVYKSLFEGTSDAGIFTRRKKLTIFFSDVVGFTSRTDSMEPEDLSYQLNSYLNAMSELVIKHGGTLDKFIGDAVLVFFGDPETRGLKHDALACVNMALEMRQTIAELSHDWKKRGIGSDFQVRMGIASGYCTVGNFGSETRMEYTIIGNQVNLASRLETAAEPGQILISDETQTLVESYFECVEVPPVAAKGFSKPIRAYQVVDKVGVDTSKRGVDAEGRGFVVRVDPDKVSRSDRSTLEKTLKRALDALDRKR